MSPVPDRCPHCGSTDLGLGYQLGTGQLYPDLYAYHSASSSSPIEHIFCKSCGALLLSRVRKPERFPSYGTAREAELEDYLQIHGILLCNESRDLPSLSSLGYSMETVNGLIERHKVFTCKAFQKRSTYLSVRAYQLLRRCRSLPPLTEDGAAVLSCLNRYDCIEKEELRNASGLEKKAFDKAFDFLLEHLYITAFGGKRLNPHWYSYLYCTAERWNQENEGLHFNGDPKAALWQLVGSSMTEAAFARFVK